jgi:ribonuclease T1
VSPRKLSAGAAGLVIAVAVALLIGNSGDEGTITDFDPVTTTEATETVQTTGGGAIGGEEGAAIAAAIELVDAGGPFPHDQDGAVFQNREGLLPDQPEGYYREYTVETPGSDDRGARRLVIGREGETYYTRDHYSSFIEIEPEDYR